MRQALSFGSQLPPPVGLTKASGPPCSPGSPFWLGIFPPRPPNSAVHHHNRSLAHRRRWGCTQPTGPHPHMWEAAGLQGGQQLGVRMRPSMEQMRMPVCCCLTARPCSRPSWGRSGVVKWASLAKSGQPCTTSQEAAQQARPKSHLGGGGGSHITLVAIGVALWLGSWADAVGALAATHGAIHKAQVVAQEQLALPIAALLALRADAGCIRAALSGRAQALKARRAMPVWRQGRA